MNRLENIWGEDNTSEYTTNIFMAFPLSRNANEAAPVPNPQMVFQFSLNRSYYTFLKDTTSDEISDKIRTQAQTLPSAFGYYSRNLWNDMILGVSAGWARMNNYATLPTRQIVESRANTSTDSEDTPDGSASSVILKELTAREGDYEEFHALQTSVDLLFILELEQDKIACNLFLDYTFFLNYTSQDNNNYLVEPGFGIFRLTEGKPPDTQGASPPKNGSAVSVPFPTNISMLKRVNVPWRIAYGFVGQWKEDIGENGEFRAGIVAGYNF